MTAASPILDYLTAALDRALAELPTERRKTVFLAQAYGNWTMLQAGFVATGRQPFGGPHPEHGEMTMWDFTLLLLEIEKRQRELMVAA